MTVNAADDAASLAWWRDIAGALDPGDEPGISRIAEMLDHHPAGIRLAAAYTAYQGLSPGGYLELLREAVAERDAGEPPHLRGLAAAWALTSGLLASSPLALLIVNTAAWLDGTSIPGELLPSFEDEGHTRAAWRLVTALHALATRPDGSYSMNDDLQRLLCKRRAAPGRAQLEALADPRDAAILPICAIFDEFPDDTKKLLALIPHLTAWTSKTGGEADNATISLCHNSAAVLLLRHGRGAEAVPFAERAAKASERHAGPDFHFTLTAKGNLAMALEAAGRYTRAIQLQEEVLQSRERVFGSAAAVTWDARVNLGAVYLRAGEYDNAKEVIGQILAYREATQGPGSRDVLMMRSNLAVLHGETGDLDQAITLRRQLVTDYLRYLGPDDPDTLFARLALLGNLSQQASDDAVLGRNPVGPGAADEPDQHVAALSAALPPGDIHLLTARSYRATIMRNRGQFNEAVAEFRQLIDDATRALGPGHELVVGTASRMAVTLSRLGQHDEAVEVATRALAAADRSLGRTHEQTLSAVTSLLLCLNADRRRSANRLPEIDALLHSRFPDLLAKYGFEHELVQLLAQRKGFLDLGQVDI
jgi:tetratricopeptide (TPR) repeat protein